MPGLPPCPHCGQPHTEDVLLCPTSEKLIPLAGRVLDRKFRFVKQLGEGGMGAVWECENVLVKKTVAIKLMHVQFSKDEGVLGRFRNEATAAGRIGSKHICDILDLGRSQLGPYIVMEMLHGADFAGFMQKRSGVDPGTIVMVMRQALEGLQAAHAVGIVHRDLKPENIFLHEPEPGQLLVKLMDFGISKFTEGEMAGKTGMGVLMGTPEYMSPEQTEGAAGADHRTDIWAMGVILYWALAGRNPFMGATMASTLINVTTRDPAPITQAVPGIDPGLAAVVDRCLKKSPAERFESSEAMSAALEPFENLGGTFFVPFLSKSGTTGRATAMPRTPPPGATVASVGPPQMRPPSAPPAPAAPMAAAAVPPSSRKSEDVMVLGAAAASAGPTFSNELTGAPAGASPTIASGGDWGSFDDDGGDGRPDSNMGSGKGGFLVIALVALAAVAGGGYFAYSAMQAPDAKAVAASAAAKAEEQQAEAKAAEDAAKAAEEAAAAALPDVGAGDEAGDESGGAAEAGAEGGAAVAGAEGGAAPAGAEGGEDEGGEDEGGEDDGGEDDGGAKPSGGSGGGSKKPSGGSGGGSKKPSGGSGGGSKPSGGDGGGDDGGGDDGGGSGDKGTLTPKKGPRDTPATKKKKKKGGGKKKKKKGGKKKNKKLSPGG